MKQPSWLQADLRDGGTPQLRYRLRPEEGPGVVAGFTDIEGFFVGPSSAEADFDEPGEEWPDPLTITLVNPVLDPVLRQAGDEEVELGNLLLDVLDPTGRTIGHYWLSSAALERVPVSSKAVEHATVTAWVTKYPHHAAKAIWERWRSGPPTELNLWAQLSPDHREAWLEVVGTYHFAVKRDLRDTPRSQVVLDGRFVTDLPGFFCAVGEAVNGPGGYYGWNTMALVDCLGHGFGTDGDFTLVWEHSDVAREHLATVLETEDGPVSYFDYLVSCFHHRGKKVVLR